MDLTRGARLGPYEIQSTLGEGGMGRVYKARDTRLDRTVAIKVLTDTLASDAQFRLRFDREARVISQLSHPHICTLYDIGEYQPEAAPATAFLVMEYLEGTTLADRMSGAPLRVDEAIDIFTQIASALQAAHDRAVVHRDLKPGNIMLTAHGAKLMDFGLAKSVAAPASVGPDAVTATTPLSLTGNGAVLGTLPYMSPEQLEGRESDFRDDLFALGRTMHEVLAGDVPIELERIILKCLRKRREDRYQSTADLCVDLRSLATIPSEPAAPATSAAEQLWRWYHVVIGVMSCFILILVWYAWTLADVKWKNVSFIVTIAAWALNISARGAMLVLFVTSRESFLRQCMRFDIWRRIGGAIGVMAVVPLGISLSTGHPGMAAIALGWSVACLASSELIEPALARAALALRKT